jgi:acyl dehydratase
MSDPEPPATALYFEDLAAGQVYTSGPIQVSADRIKSFALEFDPQAQHIDEVEAKDSSFGELVASGWHTSAITMRLMYEGFINRFGAGGMGLGVENMRWLAPVRPGDELTAHMTLDAVRGSASKPGFGVVTMTVITQDQDQRPVLKMTVSSLVGRRPG